MRFENIFQFIVPLTFFAIWALTQHYADFDVQVRAVLGPGHDPYAEAGRFLETLFTRLLDLDFDRRRAQQVARVPEAGANARTRRYPGLVRVAVEMLERQPDRVGEVVAAGAGPVIAVPREYLRERLVSEFGLVLRQLRHGRLPCS